MKKTYKLSAGTLCVELIKTEQGIGLAKISDLKTKCNVFSGIQPLMNISVRAASESETKEDETLSCNTLSGWSMTTVTPNNQGVVIALSGNDTLIGVTAMISAQTDPVNSKIIWNVSLYIQGDKYSLYECDYPVLSFNSAEHIKFMSPYGCGEVWCSAAEELSSTQNYPSYGVSMQFFSLWNEKTKRGIYYGVHDSAPAYKKFSFKKNKTDDFVRLYATMPMTDISSAGNSQSLYGSLVWQAFDGDWYDAAMLYREWALSNASWIPANTGGVRNDIPEWVKRNPHWWLVRIGNDDSYAETVMRCNRELGVPSAVHMYDWHQIPYDNDYPHYFPVKDNMVTGLYKLKNAGVRVMPYINGRLWDTRDRGLEDWQFSSTGKPNCTKNRYGEPFIETYNSKETDGSHVRHSIMCPSSAVWQEKVTENASRLLNEYNVNAVYIDQIAAASPYLCEDKNHAHRPGGGSWWCESYTNLLDHVRLIKPKNTAISTECTAEPFMKNIQMYLTWLWVKSDQVPAFPAIYSGLVVMFGRRYNTFPDDDDQGQRMTIAESLVYGEQLGWINPLTYEKLQCKSFYNKCVKFRYQNSSFFTEGRMLRPPVITENSEKLFTDKDKDAYNGILTHSPVYGGMWECTATKERIMLLVNASDKQIKCKVSVEIPDGKHVLDGEYKKTIAVKNGRLSCSLEPESVSYIKF